MGSERVSRPVWGQFESATLECGKSSLGKITTLRSDTSAPVRSDQFKDRLQTSCSVLKRLKTKE